MTHVVTLNIRRSVARLIYGLCLFAFGFIALAAADEVIKNFDVEIVVSENGDFNVSETLTINVEGKNIRRGIFRDLPRYAYREDMGDVKVPERYKIISVTRNGQREMYERTTAGNAMRIRIGDPERMVSHGEHIYRIEYIIRDQIRRQDDFDAIYWNVTGNYWRFPINKATARITVPDGAIFRESNIYTGAQGSTGDDAVMRREGDAFVYETTRVLDDGEGLTVSLAIEKGAIASVNTDTNTFLWWVKNGALTILSLSFLGIGGLYYRNWNKVGRDPQKLPVFARYQPPEGYSAAAVSYIHYKGVRGHKALVATLMSLAGQKYITLDSTKKTTVITREDDGQSVKELPKDMFKDDANLLEDLFPPTKSSTITLRKKYNKRFTSAYLSFQNRLRVAYGKPYYALNAGYIILGIFLSLAAFAVSISQFYGTHAALFFWLLGGLVLMNIVFFFLMPARTKKGETIGSEIAGFKLYLETAEKGRFDAVEVLSDAPPPMSITHYEAMLPYAIALGVEGPWTEYFEKVLPEEARDYQPVWGGAHGNFASVSAMTDNVISNISSGVSSAQPQSSSSSGSGGGGFSGGGGGGGGGGGW